jgi:hypothetical protein
MSTTPDQTDQQLDELDAILAKHYFDTCEPALAQSKIFEARAEAKAAIQQLTDRESEVAEVKSLLRFRKLYDGYELRGTRDFEDNPIATWSGYKHFRNPLSDRIEEITRFRSDQEVKKWLVAAAAGSRQTREMPS